MRASFPIALNENLTVTMTVSLKMGRDMQMQALRNGVQPDELENLMMQKLEEISQELEDRFGLSLGD